MDLSKIFEKRHEAAKYSVKEIEYIIKTFGKRDPGSEGERKACEYMAKVLRDDCGCDRVTIESFKLHPKSFYGWLYFNNPCFAYQFSLWFGLHFFSYFRYRRSCYQFLQLVCTKIY